MQVRVGAAEERVAHLGEQLDSLVSGEARADDLVHVVEVRVERVAVELRGHLGPAALVLDLDLLDGERRGAVAREGADDVEQPHVGLGEVRLREERVRR